MRQRLSEEKLRVFPGGLTSLPLPLNPTVRCCSCHTTDNNNQRSQTCETDGIPSRLLRIELPYGDLNIDNIPDCGSGNVDGSTGR